MARFMRRRTFLAAAVGAGLTVGAACSHRPLSKASAAHRIPVILDSDIGDDIDDTWALLMLLRSPQIDLKMVVSDYGNALYRCRLYARLLETFGRSDVPIGIGLNPQDNPGRQSDWVGDYSLDDYPGSVRADGVDAMIEYILASPEPVTLLCVGPVPNIAQALRRAPEIAENARFVGMHGSIRVGYNGAPEPSIEWNVKVDPASLQAVFAAPWDITLAPLDTCGTIVLDGDNYGQLYASPDPALRALMENYKVFLPGAPYVDPSTDPSKISTTLFDTLAVYLTHTEDLVQMEDLLLSVTDDGKTIIDPEHGRPVRCATGWRDQVAFEQYLTKTLLQT